MGDDARTGRRFPLQLPITIHHKTKQKGTTSNVSAAGVFIEADAKVSVGSAIRFEITLPGPVIGAKKDVAIECNGRVVRQGGRGAAKAKAQKGSGLACVIDSYRFVRR